MKKVLIVDDAMFIRLTLKLMLEKNGFQVIGEAENGAVAIAKYQQLKPDIVTMDITMPELDGISAVKKIKELDSKANIIMVSSMGMELMVRDAIVAGAKDFILKPFQEENVIKVLNKIKV